MSKEAEPMYYDPNMFPPLCWRCGTSVNVTFEPDPFDAEVRDDDRPVWMCEDCRDDMKNEI